MVLDGVVYGKYMHCVLKAIAHKIVAKNRMSQWDSIISIQIRAQWKSVKDTVGGK